MASGKWRPMCLGLNVLNNPPGAQGFDTLRCIIWTFNPRLVNWNAIVNAVRIYNNQDNFLSVVPLHGRYPFLRMVH